MGTATPISFRKRRPASTGTAIRRSARQSRRGWSWGGISAGIRRWRRLAEILIERFPSLERLRFVNSGTEANMFNVQLARVVTGRPGVLGFQGCYHGGFLTFTAKTNPLNVPFETVVGTYNDVEGTAALIDAHADRLAAVIVEPLVGGGGCIPASLDFLRMLRERTERHGIMLIFDEVMTSRLSPGGMQAVTGVTPDLTSLGKYIGGGFSAGAFGGRAEVMDRFDPRRGDALPHSGTYNNNVFTLSAGIAGLTRAYTPEAAKTLNARGEALRARLNGIVQRAGVAMQFLGYGSMMAVHMQRGEVRSPGDAAKGNAKLRELFFFDLFAQGIYVMPRRALMALALPIRMPISTRWRLGWRSSSRRGGRCWIKSGYPSASCFVGDPDFAAVRLPRAAAPSRLQSGQFDPPIGRLAALRPWRNPPGGQCAPLVVAGRRGGLEKC